MAFANCIGQADEYVIEAAVYSDVQIIKDANIKAYATLEKYAQSVSDDELRKARAEGRAEWKKRSSILKTTGMNGPAWDDHVAASIKCGEIRSRLVDVGIEFE